MKKVLCSKCAAPMKKGHFLPPVIGPLGVKWTAAEEVKQRGIRTLTSVPTFQYLCPECGVIETYAELQEPKDSDD